MFLIRHALTCTNEDCNAHLTNDGAVDVHYVVDHAEFDIPSKLDSAGLLIDNEGLIAIGKHAGSVCMACSEQLDELEISPVLVDEEDGIETPPWYVLWDGTREISGPMSKKDALDVAPFNNGFAFSGEMFSSTHIAEALQKLLEAEFSKDRSEMIAAIKSVVTSDIIMPHTVRELLTQAAEVLLFLSSERLVYIEVRSGVADVETLPDGVTVFIDDYDVVGSVVEPSTNPETGEKYHRREFSKKFKKGKN